MRLTIFNPVAGLSGDDFSKNRRTVIITYQLPRQRKPRHYQYSFPVDVLTDIGPKELAARIYSVFKQHVGRLLSDDFNEDKAKVINSELRIYEWGTGKIISKTQIPSAE